MKTLVVEDDPVFSDVLATALRRRGFDVTVALTCEQATACIEASMPELAVVDLRIGLGSGLTLIPLLTRGPRPAHCHRGGGRQAGCQPVPDEASRRRGNRRRTDGARCAAAHAIAADCPPAIREARRVGAHPAGADGEPREYFRDGPLTGDSSPDATAQTPEAPGPAVGAPVGAPSGAIAQFFGRGGRA
jgi:CheY-like chemotaxis protein